MIEIEKFDKDIMRKATYYETISYVADYVQRFLEKIFEGGEIEVPVPIDMLLEKLEIEVEYNSSLLSRFNMKDLAGIFEFNDNKKIIKFSPDTTYEHIEWMKIKFLATYLIYYEDSQDKSFDFFEHNWPQRQYVKRLDADNGIVDMVAWQIMLPWKQNIGKLKEISICDYEDAEMYYNHSVKNFCEICAYYHLLRTIEAKGELGELSKKELLKIYGQVEDMRYDKPKRKEEVYIKPKLKPTSFDDILDDMPDKDINKALAKLSHIGSCMFHDPFG